MSSEESTTAATSVKEKGENKIRVIMFLCFRQDNHVDACNLVYAGHCDVCCRQFSPHPSQTHSFTGGGLIWPWLHPGLLRGIR